MRGLKWLGCLAVTVIAAKGFCGGLFAPFSMDSAEVMPKGVKRLGVNGFTAEVKDRYNGLGNIEILGNGFNKPITWGELIDSTPAGVDRGQFKGGLEALGVDMAAAAGETRGIVTSRVTAALPVFAYGLTDQLSVGVALPVLYSAVSVSAGWKANPEFQATLNKLSQQGYYNKVLSYESDLQNVVATKMASYGYTPLENQQRTDLGDMNLAAKYQAYKDEKFAVAVSPRLVLPTGRTADVNKLVDISSGDGQVDVGVAAVGEYRPSGKLSFFSGVGYTYQVPNRKAARVPTAPNETLTPDVDGSTYENLGDIMGVAGGARYQLGRLWTVGTAYSFQYKEPDKYDGSSFAPERYQYMSIDTEQTMHAAQVSVAFSTVPLFASKQFELPLETSLNYTRVLGGLNVNHFDLVSVELASYF